MQARLAVPVLAAAAVLVVRPFRPQRDLPAAGQVALAAAAVAGAAAWHGVGPSWLPVWRPAADLLGAANRWLGDAMVARSVPVSLVAVVAGIAAAVLVDALDSRSRRTTCAAYRWPWTALRVAVVAVAAGWLARAAGVDPAELAAFGRQTYVDFIEFVRGIPS